MSRISQKASLCLGLSIAVMVVLATNYLHWIYSGVVGHITRVDSLVASFVADVGRMPESQDELITKGYLKRDIVDGIATYYRRQQMDDRDGWAARPVSLDMFGVSYGARKEDFVLRDGILVDRQTGQPRSLLTGPYNRAFFPTVRPEYERVSRRWFSLMRDPSQGVK